MITYNSTYVKKLSKDVSEVEKVFYEIPAAFTKDANFICTIMNQAAIIQMV